MTLPNRCNNRRQGKADGPEIPRAQHQAAAHPLAHIVMLPERNSAMTQAYASGCDSLEKIGQAFGFHYTTVGQRGMVGVLQCKT